jgi:hypothetical protein
MKLRELFLNKNSFYFRTFWENSTQVMGFLMGLPVSSMENDG